MDVAIHDEKHPATDFLKGFSQAPIQTRIEWPLSYLEPFRPFEQKTRQLKA